MSEASCPIDPELLELIRCPETLQPLSPASEKVLERINAAIEVGKCVNRSGHKVEQTITAALICQDGKWCYPVRNNIPVMLIEEAISMASVPDNDK